MLAKQKSHARVVTFSKPNRAASGIQGAVRERSHRDYIVALLSARMQEKNGQSRRLGAVGIRWRILTTPDGRTPPPLPVFCRPYGACGYHSLSVPTVETVGSCRSPLRGGSPSPEDEST